MLAEHLLQVGDRARIQRRGCWADVNERPAGDRVTIPLQAHLLGDGSEPSVVIAPPTAGVLDPAALRDYVRRLVEQNPEHVERSPGQRIVSDKHLARAVIAVI